jgi:O-methyltransferase involved in polyketide biosynthesis
VPGIDTTKPSVARIYDYWLGGRDNFEADREQAGKMVELNPSMPRLVRENRRFLCAAAALSARDGIGQFLDLGAGLPAQPSIHEAARKGKPGARVCYVDNDPAAVAHGKALLAPGAGLADADGLAVVAGDLTDPDAVLADPEVLSVIDLAQPVGIILGAVLHFLPHDEAGRLCAAYLSRAAAGSRLIVSVGHYEDKELAEKLQRAATHAGFYNHDTLAVTSWLDGLEIAPPGVCGANQWVVGSGGTPALQTVYALAGVGIKKGD